VDNPPFVEHCLELLSPLGPVRARRMFGGWGIYADGLFVALVAAERLYLKADGQTRAQFAAAGCEAFSYGGADKAVTLGYWTVPPEALESPAPMLPWAQLALQAALRARAGRLKPPPAAPRGPRAAPKATARKTATRPARKTPRA